VCGSGLLGRRPDWEAAHPGQRVPAEDPHVTIVGAITDGRHGVRWPLRLRRGRSSPKASLSAGARQSRARTSRWPLTPSGVSAIVRVT